MGVGFFFNSSVLSQSEERISGQQFFLVRRVIDGDTIQLSDNRKVRLTGIDTPELHFSKKLLLDSKRSQKDVRTIQELGKKSRDFTRALCLNKEVRLEYDVQKKDKYGRVLAYVYLKDGQFVNARIMEEGFAQVMTVPPNVKYADHFVRLEREAREHNKGLWAGSFAR